MNHKERFLTAVRREVPDSVPVAPLIHNRFAYNLLGRTGWKAVFEAHRMVGSTYFRGPTSVGFDISWPTGWYVGSRVIERSGNRMVTERRITTPIGELKSKSVSGMIPNDLMVSKTLEYYVKTDEDYKIFEVFWEEWLKRAEPNLSEITEAYQTMGNDGVPNVGLGAAFTELVGARGVQDCLLDLYRRPEMVKDVLNTLQRVKEKQVEAFLESPSEVLYYDVWGAFDMSPGHFRKWVLPDLKRTVRQVREKDGKYVGFYMVGKIRALLPVALEAEPDYIDPFEFVPPTIGDISIKEAKKLYGEKICIIGNFNPLIAAFGTSEEAKQETLRCLEEGMEGGGYVLATSDEVPGNAKLENLRMMVTTVEKYGKY